MNKLETRFAWFATAFKELDVSSDLAQRDDPEEGTGGADGVGDVDGDEEETVASGLSGGE